MESFENSLIIERDADDVFAFLAHFENVPRWNYAIEATTKTSPGPVGVGSRYRQTRSVPRRAEEGFEVTAFEPGRRLAVEGQIGPFEARLSYLLEPVDSATRLTNTVDLQPTSRVLRLVAPLAVSRVKAAVADNLAALKRLLEGEERVSGRSPHPNE
jgi:Polyketide cyclase / dehydrase and lipid transport